MSRKKKISATAAWYAAEAHNWCALPGSKRARHAPPSLTFGPPRAKARDDAAPWSARRGRLDLAVLLGVDRLYGKQVDSTCIGRPCTLNFTEESRVGTGVVLDQRRGHGQEFLIVYFEAQDGHPSSYVQIKLPPYEQFQFLEAGSVPVSRRVAEMLPGGPPLQEREFPVALDEPPPLDYSQIYARLVGSEVDAIQKVLRTGAKSAKRTVSVNLGHFPRAPYDATVRFRPEFHKLLSVKRSVPRWDSSRLESYRVLEESIVRKSAYESPADFKKLEGIYDFPNFHMCLRGRPPGPGKKPLRLEVDNPGDVQVLTKLVREYNYSTEQMSLRISWRRIVNVLPVDAQKLRLGDSYVEEEAPTDPAWGEHVRLGVEFVHENKEYTIEEIFVHEDEDAVRSINVRNEEDVLELPAAKVEEIIKQMILPRAPAPGDEPPP